MIIFIILISFILRFYQLTSLPPSLDWDEVSNAYNGYSILKTGKDEFGQGFPILFRAYDGYVPPVLIYLNSISAFLFGLNEFSARIPNALLGTLAVLGIYLLAKKLFKKDTALLAALFLAISPWHILYSRINTFPQTPLFFIVFGTYFFLIGLAKSRFLILSVLNFILAIFSYFSAYVFVPIFAAALAVLYRKQLGALKICLLIAPIILSSFLILFIIPGGQNRLQGVSVFADQDLIKEEITKATGEGFVDKTLHNRRFVYAQKFLEGYFVNFRFDFLFGKADAVERMIIPGPAFGLLYLWDLPFLLVGIFSLITKKPDGWKIFLTWLLLSPLAASSSLPQPTSTRTTLMIPALVIISAYGFWSYTKSKPQIITKLLILLLAFNFLLFAHQFFGHFKKSKSSDWFFGYKELFVFLNNEKNISKKLYFVFKQHDSLDQIHMFTLFYNRIDPQKYQAAGGTVLGCVGTTGQFSFDRYNFVPLSCLTHPFNDKIRQLTDQNLNKNSLIVTSQNPGVKTIEKIYFPNGTAAFYIYETN